LTQALSHGVGSLSAAARLLGVSRPTLYGLLETHGLTRQVADGDFGNDGEGNRTQSDPPDVG
jgi:hypothetical protein